MKRLCVVLSWLLVDGFVAATATAQSTVPESALKGPVFSMQGDGSGQSPVPGRPPLPGAPVEPGPAAAPPASMPSRESAPPPAAMPAPAGGDAMATAYISGLQRALPAHGYRVGPDTGTLDPVTAAAIRAYQHDAGMPQDTRSTMSLKATLDSVSFARPPIMAAGSRTTGAAGSVTWVQRRLELAGYPVGAVDGRLGRQTREAISRFEQARGLPVDGTISPRLVTALGG